MRRHIPDGCPAGEKARNIKTIKRWKTAAGVSAFLAALAAVVVLAVPALTMENAKVLSCRFSPHSHTAGCYDEDGNAKDITFGTSRELKEDAFIRLT